MSAGNGDALGRLELQLGRLLFAGVMSSAICLGVGLVLAVAGAYPAAANAILTIGLVILMITPIGRVVASLVVYARQGDWFFVATTIMVFVVLLLACFLKTKS
jgi:uncharacterized membrane protein